MKPTLRPTQSDPNSPCHDATTTLPGALLVVIVVVVGGSFNPVHLQHIHLFYVARRHRILRLSTCWPDTALSPRMDLAHAAPRKKSVLKFAHRQRLVRMALATAPAPRPTPTPSALPHGQDTRWLTDPRRGAADPTRFWQLPDPLALNIVQAGRHERRAEEGDAALKSEGTWGSGGSQYPWNSPLVVALFVAAAALAAAFAFVQANVARNPIIPVALLSERRLLATMMATFFFGCSFNGLIFYVLQWYQIVMGASATSAGLRSFPLILGGVLFAVLASLLSSATGHAWAFIPTSGLLLSLGAALCSLLSETTPTLHQTLILLTPGVGGGLAMQTLVLLTQFAAPPQASVSAVNALAAFCESLGGAIGLSAFAAAFNAAAFNAVLPGNVQQNVAAANVTLTFTVPGVDEESLYKSAALVRTVLPEDQWTPVVHGYLESLRVVFYMIVATSGMVAVCSLFMRKKRLPSGKGVRLNH
ncbi:major facilitator superfamily domain-containing protein [Zopfochytrium polystomum]|nr:major facilitator superfamily domain-containing protein [Zopfochytrium polystomum]